MNEKLILSLQISITENGEVNTTSLTLPDSKSIVDDFCNKYVCFFIESCLNEYSDMLSAFLTDSLPDLKSFMKTLNKNN